MAGLTREELEKIIRLQTEEDTLPAEDLQSSIIELQSEEENPTVYTPSSREYDPVRATTDDVSILGDAFKGLVSGTLIGVPEGIATLGFGLYDALADDDTLRDLDAFTSQPVSYTHLTLPTILRV